MVITGNSLTNSAESLPHPSSWCNPAGLVRMDKYQRKTGL